MKQIEKTEVALPRYADLPIDPSKPARSAWGVFGDDDQVGTINLLTPERVRAAAALVHKGTVFSLNWDVEKPGPPLLGRESMQHRILDLNPGTDDIYDRYYTQSSTQWDALCHMPHPEYGYYNGVQREEITGRPGSRNGIDHWARRGIVGRFVLADVDRYLREQGRPIDASQRVPIEADDIEATLKSQSVQLQGGDILLVRMGWITWYETLDEAACRQLSETPVPEIRTPGLSQADRTLEWLWDNQVAAVAVDVPGLEALPYVPTVEGFLHFRIIPMLGMAVGEMFALDALAADCAGDGVYEGMFTAAPLNKVGGSGSPGNALAIK